jgi:hypothetical protein
LAVSGAGLISWPTSDANAGSSNAVTVRVFDSGAPSLSATGTFNVVVAARPLLKSPALTSSNATLSWSSIAGTSYRVQYVTNLNFPNWNDLAGDVAAVSTNATKMDATAPITTNRLYRVRVLP